MEKIEVKNSSVHKKNSEEAGGRHPNSVSVENVDKLTIRTKNGLVNGIAEEKCKSNKKHSKSSINSNVSKDSKKNKKGHGSGIQNNEINVTNLNPPKRSSSQKSNKISLTTTKNCIDTEINQECKIEISSTVQDNCKEDVNIEINQLKPSQSESISKELQLSKSETKRKKNKAKINKTEQTVQTQQSEFNLPKFDITSIMNTTINNENLISKIPSETPSTSQLDSNKSYLLEYQDASSSEFEKNLIESIKSLKIQQENAAMDAQCDGNETDKIEAVEMVETLQEENLCDITYVQYESELQMPMIMKIIQKDLSEPYSIYTYRYFIHNWPKLCFLAMCEDKCVGAIVCKLDFHRKTIKRGYIAMLAVDKDYRKRRIGSTLVRRAISEMIAGGADEVVLETEVTNKPALRLYEQLGFVRDKRLFRYYLNGVDALRLKLWLR